MNPLYSALKTGLCALVLAVGLTTIGEIPAVGQDTDTSQQLERIDVEAPERRPVPRAATTPRPGAGYDEPAPMDWPSSEDSESPSQVFSGSGIPASTLSLVTQKSQVSLSAESLPAQVQVVTSQDIERLNIHTYADLFKKIPGVRAYNFGQGELGNPISMRGFAGTSNGNETCIFVDGVPQNFPSLAAGTTGTSELYWLAPEVIERIEIIKGPFSALYGDFTLAGVINIITKKSETSPSLNAYGGSFGTFRALGVVSRDTWVPTPYLAHEYYTTDGYRDNSDLKRWSPFNKVSMPVMGGILSLRFNYYASDFGAPGYLQIDAVRQGLYKRTDAVNSGDGGSRRRYEVVLNYAPLCGERGLYSALYVGHLHRRRWYQFPPTDPKAQDDRRLYWGGRLYYNLVFGDIASLTVGGETRQDSGPSMQGFRSGRQFTSYNFIYGVKLSNWAWFLQGQIKPAPSIKIVGGIRGDYFTINVDSELRPENSGIGHPQIVSPKIGFVITPTKYFNIFGNVGSGFRSPGAQEVSPYSAGKKKNFGFQPPRLDSCDVGCNLTLFDSLYLAADYYHTINSDEIKSINSQPVNIGQTMRKGYELSAKYFASKDVNVFGSYAWVDAKVTDPVNPGQALVPSIAEHTIKGGIEIQKDFGAGRKVLADAYYEYLSGAPNYNGKNPVPKFGPDYDVYNFKLAYEGQGWSSFVSARYWPREFAGPYSGMWSGLCTFDPQPKWLVTSGLTYTFW